MRYSQNIDKLLFASACKNPPSMEMFDAVCEAVAYNGESIINDSYLINFLSEHKKVHREVQSIAMFDILISNDIGKRILDAYDNDEELTKEIIRFAKDLNLNPTIVLDHASCLANSIGQTIPHVVEEDTL